MKLRPRAFPRSRSLAPLLLPLLAAACSDPPPAADPPPAPGLRLTPRASGTDRLLQAVSPAGGGVVWVSGHGGVWVRSTDGGATWEARTGPGGDSLQFRDVHAEDARTAWLLAAGEGAASRIYRTDDGGTSWTLQFIGERPEVFLDCLDFWDAERGVAWGDAVDGVPFVLLTDDGGRTWRRVDASTLPPAGEGEGGFAASGSCVRVAPGGGAWIATGNGPSARVLRTDDFGRSWRAHPVPPVEQGETAGLTALVLGARPGVAWAFGGRLDAPDATGRNAAITEDGGATWRAGGAMALRGAVYGAAGTTTEAGSPVLVVVGPGGFDASFDGGATWRQLDPRSWWAVEFGGDGRGWAVGPEGRIVAVEVGAGDAPGA